VLGLRRAGKRLLVPGSGEEQSWPPTEWAKAWRAQHDRLVWGLGSDWDVRQREVSMCMDIPEPVRPIAGEALIFDGDQFHRILSSQRIRVLLYAGFETNECLQFKSYGLANMQLRGYLCCAIREATTTYESAETLEGLWRTRVALEDIEARFGYTVSAWELIESSPSRG
jgi:hypothetical protein